MKRMSMIGALVVVTVAITRSAQALPILEVEGALTLADPTQLGRLSRNAIGQDWAGGEPFPGVINPTTSYHYLTYVLNVGITPFIQILFDSVSLNTFVSAYDTSYLPNSAALPNLGLDRNWLGDAGVSGNDFGTNPLFFQVLVPENHDLVIVVNNTAAGNVGVGDPFRLTVEGFIDSQFSEPAQAVPEAATGVLAMTGFVLLALTNRRRNPSVVQTASGARKPAGARRFSCLSSIGDDLIRADVGNYLPSCGSQKCRTRSARYLLCGRLAGTMRKLMGRVP